jgi:phosphofructokinase-like protein
MRIGILTAGGDCPGLNAAIRGVGKTAIATYGMEVIGIASGFEGLIVPETVALDESSLSGILTLGGTILGTSREKPFAKDDLHSEKADRIIANFRTLGLDCLVCIGGNGTMKTAFRLAEAGLPVVGIPKTIDNDVWGTDYSFGFFSSLEIATEALDRLHTTANSHKRIMVMEVMGHHTGWLALYAGVAGGADLILIPEIEYSGERICGYLKERWEKGKPYSIVVVAEGIRTEEGPGKQAAHHISRLITRETGLETRETVLGYVQRGGVPTAADRILATRFGARAARMIAKGRFGSMVALQKNRIVEIPLAETAGRLKYVAADDSLIKKARGIGTCFGD